MRLHLTLIAALLSAMPAFAQDERAVMIGGDVTLDACGGYGQVSGLDPDGANVLSVRAGPGRRFARIDRIGTAQTVWICEREGDWLGVIYSRDDTLYCGINTPISLRAPYDGPCDTGWVFARYITILAG